MKYSMIWRAMVAGAGLATVACGGGTGADAGDAAPDGSVQPPIDVPAADAPPSSDASLAPDGGLPADFFPARPPAFRTTDNAPLSIQVSISGEALAEAGYAYNANPGMDDPPVFVDGWEVRFDKYIVVVDRVRLNQPASDVSMRGAVGALVAQQDGPWVVDVHKRGPLVGSGGAPETATPLFVFTSPSAGGMFDPTTRYAFSYDAVPANARPLRNANLGEDARADVTEMIARGWTHLFAGTATYRGRMPGASVDPTFQNYPRVVRFRFGFGAPASYINCHNPALGEEDAPANRGVQPNAAGAVRAQLTMHTDHFFWTEANVEGTPLYFDPLAARASGFGSDPMTPREVTLTELAGSNPTALTDALGMPVLNRGGQTTGTSTNAAPPSYALNGAAMVTTLRDFVVYNARSQGHLNSDGLCFVQPTGPLAY